MPKQACHVALGALRLADQLLSARCARYLRDFHTSLIPAADSTAVRQFTEQAAASALWRHAIGRTTR
jgi:hypothetical protein